MLVLVLLLSYTWAQRPRRDCGTTFRQHFEVKDCPSGWASGREGAFDLKTMSSPHRSFASALMYVSTRPRVLPVSFSCCLNTAMPCLLLMQGRRVQQLCARRRLGHLQLCFSPGLGVSVHGCLDVALADMHSHCRPSLPKARDFSGAVAAGRAGM